MAYNLTVLGLALQLLGVVMVIPQLLVFTGAPGALDAFAERAKGTSRIVGRLAEAISKSSAYGEEGWAGNLRVAVGGTLLWWGPVTVTILCEACPNLIGFTELLATLATFLLTVVITVNTSPADPWEEGGWFAWNWPWPLRFVASIVPAALLTTLIALFLPLFLLALLLAPPFRSLGRVVDRALGTEYALRQTTAWVGFGLLIFGLIAQLLGTVLGGPERWPSSR